MVYADGVRHLALAFALIGLTLGTLSACDKTRDFECTAIWGRGDKELSKKVYTYEALETKEQAAKLCREQMLDEKPPRAKSAQCDCIGEKK